MLYQQLKNIRGQLRRGEMKVSDGLLIVSRYLRDRLPAERLIWMNRELLGYRREDLSELYDNKPTLSQMLFSPASRRPLMEVPHYRFLSGAWGNVDGAGRLVCVNDPRLIQKSIFCNIGIQQIETQLDEMDEPANSLFSMSMDPQSGAEFYCWSDELLRVYESVRRKLCEFILVAIEELKLAPNEA